MAESKTESKAEKNEATPEKKLYHNHTGVDQGFYIGGRLIKVLPKATVELTEAVGTKYRLFLTEGPPAGIKRADKKGKK